MFVSTLFQALFTMAEAARKRGRQGGAAPHVNGGFKKPKQGLLTSLSLSLSVVFLAIVFEFNPLLVRSIEISGCSKCL